MLTDKLCCNCRYYEGVHGVQGVAPCKYKNEMVLWNDSCDDIYQISNRLISGTPTKADKIRSMTDEELAAFIDSVGGCPPSGEVECIGFDCVECILEWLKREVNE